MTVSPDTGLTNGQSLMVTGSGFTPNSIGNLLECNNAPNEPTVTLPAPVSAAVPIGCTVIGYGANGLATVKADGTLSKTWTVSGGTVGPPCGVTNALVMTCPADSAGQSATSDAANYPCPPTAAQQAAGVTCSVTFGDQAGDSSNPVVLLFQGESAPTSTTTTAAPTTTAAAAPTTTAAVTHTTVATAASGGTLATTGPGPMLWWVAAGAIVLVGAGVVLWVLPFGLARRRATRPGG